MTQRLLGYRVFADDQGRMNRSLADSGGGLLLVSQFTLAADTRSGMRAGFSTAAAPEEAERVFSRLLASCRKNHAPGVETGRFGAHMVVSLRSEEHTSELQSLMRISYAVFCLKKKKKSLQNAMN